MTAHEIRTEIGVTFLIVSHGLRWVLYWEENWNKARSLFGRRLGDTKMSLSTIINGITLAEQDAIALSAFMAKLPAYLPEIQKQLADLQQAMADKSNPTAEVADISNILNDLNTDLSTVVPMIQNLLPSLTKAAPPAAA
jgi:hypothetical protein